MDAGARIIRRATPRFAKIVSHKFAHGAATQVLEDLEQNHGRPCLKATLQDLATHVGTVVQTKKKVGVTQPRSWVRLQRLVSGSMAPAC